MSDYSKRVPKEYYDAIIDKGGMIEKVSYTSKRYATDNSDIEKRALVYLPKGIDKNGDKRYKTLYLMHGGGGNEEEFLFGQDSKRSLLYIIDHMIANGELEPMIIVTPSFYYEACQSVGHDITEAATLTKAFPNEFRNELLPYIEANYPVLRGRENRAFGGFSMGGETTWEIMLNCLDLVSNFMPLSGDCWIVEEKGGASKTEETVEMMEQKLRDNRFDKLDINIFAFTGEKDIAFPALDAQIKCMLERGWNKFPVKVRYGTWADGIHWYPWIYEYIYNILPDLF